MKKIVLLGIAATALLTACSNDDVVEVKTTSPIGFNTFVENSTRADLIGEVKTNNIAEFGVWGFTTPSGGKATQIFDSEKVSKSDGTWGYLNTQYWVAGNDYAFAALSPIPSSSNNISYSLGESPSAPTGTVTFIQDAIAERDLVYAYKAIESAATNTAGSWDAVPFTFDHLLSRVAVKVTNSSDNAQNTAIRISNVKLAGAAIKGTFTTSSDISNTTWSIDANSGYMSSTTTPSAIEIGATTAGTKVYFPSTASGNVTINADNSEYGVAPGKAAQAQWAYIIPLGSTNDKTYTITFDVEVYQAVSNSAGTEGASYQRYPQNSKSVYTVSFTTTADQAKMTKGYSYVYGISLKINDLTDKDNKKVLEPIEFTLSETGVNNFTTTDDISVSSVTVSTTTTE